MFVCVHVSAPHVAEVACGECGEERAHVRIHVQTRGRGRGRGRGGRVSIRMRQADGCAYVARLCGRVWPRVERPEMYV